MEIDLQKNDIKQIKEKFKELKTLVYNYKANNVLTFEFKNSGGI